MPIGHTKRTALALFAGAALLLGAGPGALAEDWKCYTSQAGVQLPTYVALTKLAEDVEKITKGRVKVKCTPGGSMPIDANSISPAVSDGILDLVGSEYISGYVPVGGITVLPGLYGNVAEFQKLYGVLKPVIDREFNKRGIIVLSYYLYPDQVFWGKGQLKSLADLRGKTMRVSNVEQAEFAKLVGAVPVTLPTPEVAPAMQRGAVQIIITAAAAGGRLWRDHFQSALLNMTNYGVGWYQISKKRFDSLSPEEQKELQAAADKWANWATKSLMDDTAAALKDFAEKDKMVITQQDPAEQAKIGQLMEPYWKKWAEERGPEAVKVLGDIRAALGK
jgi:TRAP-type C4-dicarboxylate transport system substrate-binding protein